MGSGPQQVTKKGVSVSDKDKHEHKLNSWKMHAIWSVPHQNTPAARNSQSLANYTSAMCALHISIFNLSSDVARIAGHYEISLRVNTRKQMLNLES